MDDKLLRVVHAVQNGVVRILLVLMLVIVVFAAVQLVMSLVDGLMDPPYTELLTADELLLTFSAFLVVLIGIELVEVIRTYLEEHYIRVEFVLVVALIAAAKSVIVMDYKTSPWLILALSALITGLAVSYFLLRRAHGTPDDD